MIILSFEVSDWPIDPRMILVDIQKIFIIFCRICRIFVEYIEVATYEEPVQRAQNPSIYDSEGGSDRRSRLV